MKKERNEEKISGLAALLLFAIFAVCILFVLLSGAGIYQRLVQRDQENYDSRTAICYLAAKIRQSDRLDCLKTDENSGKDMLVITEEIDGAGYETLIYCYDGYICELFTIAGSEWLPEDGIRVLPARALEAEITDGMVFIKITDVNGRVQSLKQTLRSGKEFST